MKVKVQKVHQGAALFCVPVVVPITTPLYETTRGPCVGPYVDVAPRMAHAIFSGFPGTSGSTITVK